MRNGLRMCVLVMICAASALAQAAGGAGDKPPLARGGHGFHAGLDGGGIRAARRRAAVDDHDRPRRGAGDRARRARAPAGTSRPSSSCRSRAPSTRRRRRRSASWPAPRICSSAASPSSAARCASTRACSRSPRARWCSPRRWRARRPRSSSSSKQLVRKIVDSVGVKLGRKEKARSGEAADHRLRGLPEVQPGAGARRREEDGRGGRRDAGGRAEGSELRARGAQADRSAGAARVAAGADRAEAGDAVQGEPALPAAVHDAGTAAAVAAGDLPGRRRSPVRRDRARRRRGGALRHALPAAPAARAGAGRGA